jgi:hypothetical protein
MMRAPISLRVVVTTGVFAVASGSATALPAEVDLPFQGSGTWRVGEGTFRLQGRVLKRGDAILAERVYALPVADAQALCAVDEGRDGLGVLRCWDNAGRAVTLMTAGHPDRLAITQGHVAWVASAGSLPHVFVAPYDGRSAPRMVTNAGIVYVPGRRPEGFVPPPLGDSLRFDGPWLRWTSPEGAHQVRWSP